LGGMLLILFGVANCFYGYTYFRVLLAIWGFVLGGALGLSAASQASPVVILAAGGIGAVLGALLIYFVFRAGVFIVGAALGYALAIVLLTRLGIQGNIPVLAVGGALVAGLLALMLNRAFIVLLTAIGGASSIVIGAVIILDGERVAQVLSERQVSAALMDMPLLVGLLWLLVALLGILSQYRTRSTHA
ncbi:MAG: TMEM198/TM7SF3 family protein, partial [Anaerolineae bacterium]|nr:TMEM198/TM7SF3 family protein [Anaerolineae bacterium]